MKRYRNSGFAIFLFLTFFSAFFKVSAQQSINGRVVDEQTKTAIAGATIYINNTSIGTSTDKNGFFKLNNVGLQGFEVVVSALGYKTISKEISGQESQNLILHMQSKSVHMEEVVVTGYLKDGWKRWGLYFEETLLGFGELAKKSKILNPEVVRFKYDQMHRVLTVFCLEPLKIENKNLGYLIDYDLIEFQSDLKRGRLYFAGYAFFKELSKRPKRYEKARLQMYSSSVMRFIRSTYARSWKRDGYVVRKLIKKPNEVKIQAKKEYEELERLVKMNYNGNWNLFFSSRTDSTREKVEGYRQQMRQEDFLAYLGPELTPADIIESENTAQGVKYVKYKDYIYITSLMELIHFGKSKKEDQSTQMEVISDVSIQIDSFGNYYPANDWLFSGYWGLNSRLSQMLPLDYKNK